VRIVGGSSRGRKLVAPVAEAVRPTSDRVREAIFDILGSMTDLHGMKVADLFAGTGALGIEALSRGVGSVTFVERDPDAAKAVRVNLESTGLDGPEAVVVRRDVLDYLRALRGDQAEFDLVLCDPPYSFELWEELLELLQGKLCVLESGSELTIPSRWMVLRSRRYGSTLVTVVRATEDWSENSSEDSPEDSQGGLG
jgi:16S rRNA (guanine966-N2)-methyltransferase